MFTATTTRGSRWSPALTTREKQREAAIDGKPKQWVGGNPHDQHLVGAELRERVAHLSRDMMTPSGPSLKIQDEGQGLARASTRFMRKEIAPDGQRLPHTNAGDMLNVMATTFIQLTELLPYLKAEKEYQKLTAELASDQFYAGGDSSASSKKVLAVTVFPANSATVPLKYKTLMNDGVTLWLKNPTPGVLSIAEGVIGCALAPKVGADPPCNGPIDTNAPPSPITRDLIIAAVVLLPLAVIFLASVA